MSDKIEKPQEDRLHAMEKFSQDVLQIWANKDNIWEVFGKPNNLTKLEFDIFMSMGVALRANPFAGEIWAVKYGDKAASIFLGRDFYRRKAQEQPDYNGHQPFVVYQNDIFEYDLRHTSGLPNHKFSVTAKRGEPVGAYCIAYRKSIKRPFVVYVSMEEGVVKKKDGTPQATWKTQPVTQIEKVAEARCLRMAWQGVFKGTHSQDEEPIIEYNYKKEALVEEMEQKNTELTDALTEGVEIITQDFNNLNDAAQKLKNRLEKIYIQENGEPDPGKIIDKLMEITADKDGNSIIDYGNMTSARAKKALLLFEKMRFSNQLSEYFPKAAEREAYLLSITKHDEFEGLRTVDEFKTVEHLYTIKGTFKKDLQNGIMEKQQEFKLTGEPEK